MTTLQKSTAIAALVVSLGIAIYEAHRASRLESELQVLQGQNASLAARTGQLNGQRDDTEHQAEGAEPSSRPSNADTSELLRLRGEVGLLRRQLAVAEATPQPATNHIAFTEPYLPREAWSDHGTAKPLDTILTMFWALRQGDESKLEQMVSRVRDSQTLDELIYPKNDWQNITAIQVVKVGWARAIVGGKAQDMGSAEVIVEQSPPFEGDEKDVSMQRWSLIKMNDQWLINGCH
jgi:hypothetical protein